MLRHNASRAFHKIAFQRPARTHPARGADIDELWDIARSVRVAPNAVGLQPTYLGVVVAREHPTGWFIRASFQDGLDSDDVALFKEFVTQRVYVLLHDGPCVDTWILSAKDEWLAYCAADLGAEATEIPATVPPHWR